MAFSRVLFRPHVVLEHPDVVGQEIEEQNGHAAEKVLFCLFGGMVMLLVYCWADEFWMLKYNVRQRRWNQEIAGDDVKLVQGSGMAIGVAIARIGGGALIKLRFGHGAWRPPYYFTFLVVAALAPAIVFYRSLENLVNWRAFSFTCLYVLVTSCIWEGTLGIARTWRWYNAPPAVIG